MRSVRDLSVLEQEIERARSEGQRYFGDGRLYVERYIENPRHIEVQVLGDGQGGVVHVFERECSVQRNHQKLVEESPSVVVDSALREEMGAIVCRAVTAIGYVGAGTMEFLRDRDGSLYFMEVNTRLQVEHPVTEMVTGFDLVQEQIRVAANCSLSMTQEQVKLSGHAMEVRVNAEDPFHGFRPCPGTITLYQPPTRARGVTVRIDSHVRQGYRIPPYYDSMIGKLIVHGPDRETARRGMLDALEQFRLEGIETTIGVHKKILADEAFVRGDYDTGFIGRLLG